jgi:hypothetical protein
MRLLTHHHHHRAGVHTRHRCHLAAPPASPAQRLHLLDKVLAPERTRRVYFNSVLARAEGSRKYQPSHQLWLRTRNGFCTFNPDLQLRAHHAGAWLPWKQWLNQPLVFTGCAIKHHTAAPQPDEDSA